jgi:hypothetical protein
MLNDFKTLVDLFNIPVGVIQHFLSGDTKQIAASSDVNTALWSYTVPETRGLVITELEINSYPLDGSGNALRDLIRPGYWNDSLSNLHSIRFAGVPTTETLVSAHNANVHQGKVLHVFRGGQVVSLMLTDPLTYGATIVVQVRLSGFLLPNVYTENFYNAASAIRV